MEDDVGTILKGIIFRGNAGPPCNTNRNPIRLLYTQQVLALDVLGAAMFDDLLKTLHASFLFSSQRQGKPVHLFEQLNLVSR